MLMRFERPALSNELALKLELPYLGPMTIDLSVDPGRLTIHAIESAETDWIEGLRGLHLRDGTPAPIGLEIPLPMAVDPETTRAAVVDGFLDLRFQLHSPPLARDSIDVPVEDKDPAPTPVAIRVSCP